MKNVCVLGIFAWKRFKTDNTCRHITLPPISLDFRRGPSVPSADGGAYNHRRSGTAVEYVKEMAMPSSYEVAEKLPPLLQNYKAAMVRGHGSFAVGRMLQEAFQWASSLEASRVTLYLHRLLSHRDIKEGEGKW